MTTISAAAPNGYDIELGDLVHFTSYESISYVTGRAIGAMDANSSFQANGISSTAYLVIWEQINAATHIACADDWSIQRTSESTLNLIGSKSIVFIFGGWPKRTDRLMLVMNDPSPSVNAELSAKFKKNGFCPRCGHLGEWFAMACSCPWHGRFLG